MVDQLLDTQSAVLFSILELATELRRTASLKDHPHVGRRKVPTRINEIERAVGPNIGRARRQVGSFLVLRLMTVGTFKREDAPPVRSAAQAKTRMGLTIFPSQGRV